MSNNKIDSALLCEAFKALSNPHRLALFNRLMNCCAPGTKCSPVAAVRYCVGELGEGLDIAPSTLSHHLKELNRAGLVEMERKGKNVECWVEPARLEKLTTFFKPAQNN
ncbi:Transcriptional regulator, ArsR family [hydrothermal vent metagenome]|uniref:Transcriptional regulator, ArsR family n=1 Tax=hydrothermal vent metagenome TaxID=652676 RepID=A0A3B0Z7B3_9ZZZZ